MTKTFENIIFNNEIDPENVNTVLNTVEQMSYKRIKLIAFVGQNSENKFQVKANEYRYNEKN